MSDDRTLQVWIKILTLAGWLLGAAVIVFGVSIYLSSQKLPPLLISLAVLIAGPLEDLLKGWVRRRIQCAPKEPAVRVVDLATSVAFLILLLWSQWLLQQAPSTGL